jgi:UDP-N-acetylglucosamine 2-epimerase (non-hydrolysing)
MSKGKKSVCLVAGTRPEVIKLAPVYFALQQSDLLQPIWLSTGQHRQMLDQAMSAFGLHADFDLDLMQEGQSLTDLTSRALLGVSSLLSELKPDAVIVQGDTTTVLSTALAAFYQKIQIGHVEAGLRTYDMNSPWPEEMNRRLIAPICRWNFSPTEQARANLLSEKTNPNLCHVTGNTVIDSLLWMNNKIQANPEKSDECLSRLGVPIPFWKRFIEDKKAKWILLTLHRRESFGEGLENICLALREILEKHPDCGLLCPMHLNPSARGPVMKYLAGLEQVALVEPAGYEDFIFLMNRCHFIVSDSGGVQEEAPTLGKPVLVVRETSERMEGVEAGTCRLVGTDKKSIVQEASLLLNDSSEYSSRSALKNPYGDGKAALRICKILEAELQ